MPIPGNPGTRLPTLRACLKAARMRTRIRSMLRGAVFSLVAALALLCGLEISGLYFEMAAPAGLIAAALLIQLVPPDALAVARGSIAGAERDQAGFTGQQGAEAAANLRRIAELLGKDAQERSDPYLRTIARTLERLSADADRPSVDRHTLAGALEQLLAHARRAYGQATGAAREQATRDVVQQLQTALDDITGNRQARTAAPPEAD